MKPYLLELLGAAIWFVCVILLLILL